MAQRPRVYSPDFRREETSYIMQRWRAGESCSLIGVGSAGKSNLLQHLTNPETRAHYLGAEASSTIRVINIDPNLMAALPDTGPNLDQIKCWAAYELMMHRLYMDLYPFDMLSEEEADSFYKMYVAFQSGDNPLHTYMGLRYLELGLGVFIRQGIRIVFMFDEFEEMLKHLPAKFFQNLRGLRDANKRHLSYMTFTRSPLPVLIDEHQLSLLDTEAFFELFTDHILYVGPYNEQDATDMIQSLMSRNQKNYPEATIRFVLWATGRYAGLIRAAFRVLDQFGGIDNTSTLNDETARRLASKRPVKEECRTIWTSLSKAEHHALKATARLISFESNSESEQAINSLIQKKLLVHDKVANSLQIEPPVFRAYVNANPEIEIT